MRVCVCVCELKVAAKKAKKAAKHFRAVIRLQQKCAKEYLQLLQVVPNQAE